MKTLSELILQANQLYNDFAAADASVCNCPNGEYRKCSACKRYECARAAYEHFRNANHDRFVRELLVRVEAERAQGTSALIETVDKVMQAHGGAQ